MNDPQDETADHARARAVVPDPPDKDAARAAERAAWFEAIEARADDPKTARVLWCIKEMARGMWVPGASHQDAATKFSVSIRTIEADASEASRAIRLFTLADEDMKALVETALMRAMQMGSFAEDAARGADAITRAASVISGIRGFDAPKKHNVTVGATLDEIDVLRAAMEANKS